MKIQTPFKTRKPRKFNYQGQYYDAEEEAIKQRVKEAEARSEPSNRFSGRFGEGIKGERKTRQNSRLFRLAFGVILALAISGYLYSESINYLQILYFTIPLIIWYRLSIQKKPSKR